MAHILVVGGTGMLYDVCRHLCKSANTVTVIARNKKRLNRLASEAKELVGSINSISLDYSDSASLTSGLKKSIITHGPVELAICWIHASKAPEAARIIAETIDKQNNQTKCKYYQLLSSATADPSLEKKDISKDFDSLDNIDFRTILLGFIVERETSRWLTNNEICDGVIRAIENDAKESIIGTVEPWNRRP
ncbi:MAG: short-chain dehydrogenase [candidate division Zixibacteria bacterium]|nr:short-chain dehydrogenase [candidate division Zixibacteria bacterium]